MAASPRNSSRNRPRASSRPAATAAARCLAGGSQNLSPNRLGQVARPGKADLPASSGTGSKPLPLGVPKVALLIETARDYGRGLLRGIVRYARLHGPWAFYITPGDLAQVLPKMDEWGCNGIIARVETPETVRAVLATRLPVIALDLSREQLAGDHPLSQVSEICPNSHAAAVMAAEHLLDLGLRQFAFVGAFDNPLWSARREEGFRQRLAAVSCSCHVYPLPQAKRDRQWGREQSLMSHWLAGLPKPIGLLACDDDRGRQVLEACRAAGVHVPDDVAVIGVDNDEMLCDLADPSLSSVALDTEQAGYEAAALLDGLMAGRSGPARRILAEPMYVVPRRSTDVLVLDDREVAAALRFVHDNAGRPIGVRDVVRQGALSRRALELRFRAAMGRSIHDEIQRVRLERARRLLRETDLPISALAASCGFAGPGYLTRVFVQKFGQAPSAYRSQMRQG